MERRGQISTDGVRFYVYVQTDTKRRWEKTKRTLNFMAISQDGDVEGIFTFEGLPTADQATIIRKVLGLRRAMPLTDEQRVDLARRFDSALSKSPLSEQIIDVPEGGRYHPSGP
jgi:hypothetical protein